MGILEESITPGCICFYFFTVAGNCSLVPFKWYNLCRYGAQEQCEQNTTISAMVTFIIFNPEYADSLNVNVEADDSINLIRMLFSVQLICK
jgi:hypothetical protein